MLFNSWEFVLFYSLVLPLYFGTPVKHRWMILFVSSYVFYMAWRVDYIALIALSTFVDYAVANGMARYWAHRRFFLGISIVVNLGILAFFKYSNFFISAAADLAALGGMQVSLPTVDVALPVGISFYTFQSMGYAIDVYRGHTKAESHLLKFATYVACFPQLVAGPIERSDQLLPQIQSPAPMRYRNFVVGFRWMLAGALKKIVIADNVGPVVDIVYAAPHRHSALVLSVATFLFAFQIYCDFSGYTDIARGAARVLGIDLMENFRRPYLACSLTDFWRRWHISLSTWFRDYLYIPLGGSRVGTAHQMANLMIVFLVSGLWHGAGWNFIVWGGIHGVFLCLETGFHKLLPRGRPFPDFLARIYVFVIVVISWVFFRAAYVSDAWLICHRIAAGDGGWSWRPLFALGIPRYQILIGLGLAIALWIGEWLWERHPETLGLAWRYRAARWALYVFGLLALVMLGNYGRSEFIYFQF